MGNPCTWDIGLCKDGFHYHHRHRHCFLSPRPSLYLIFAVWKYGRSSFRGTSPWDQGRRRGSWMGDQIFWTQDWKIDWSWLVWRSVQGTMATNRRCCQEDDKCDRRASQGLPQNSLISCVVWQIALVHLYFNYRKFLSNHPTVKISLTLCSSLADQNAIGFWDLKLYWVWSIEHDVSRRIFVSIATPT